MTVLRYWLAATAILLTVMAVWAFAPVLVFVVLLIAALGLVSAAMIALALRLRAWREGKRDEAIAEYQAVLKLKPNYAEAHHDLGVALLEEGKFDEAMAQLREALRIKPDYAEAHYDLGNLLHKRGNVEEAVQAYREALRLKPDYPQAHYNMANDLSKLNRFDEAVAVIDRALEQGVTYCDTSPAYASSVDYYGAALGERRKNIFLASKTHERTRDGSLVLLEDSLRRLHTDHLDLWQLHDLRSVAQLDIIFGKGGAIEALVQARDEGRVRVPLAALRERAPRAARAEGRRRRDPRPPEARAHAAAGHGRRRGRGPVRVRERRLGALDELPRVRVRPPPGREGRLLRDARARDHPRRRSGRR